MAAERYFIDIDQTLTAGKRPRPKALERARNLIASGAYVVIWTGSGQPYARRFCKKHGLKPSLMIGKPTVIVDDSPEIVDPRLCRRLTPAQFEKGAT